MFRNIISFGGTGIHLFFVLSGFGLGFFQYQSVRGFYSRRFTKIIIPYYIFITLVFLLNLIIPVYPDNGLKEWLSHIFFYKMFFEGYIESFGYHLWFMSTIIQFYLIFPLIVWLFNRFGSLTLLIGSVLVSFIYLSVIIYADLDFKRVWNSFFLSYFWEFILGFLISVNIKLFYSLKLQIRHYLILVFAGLGLMGFMQFEFGQIGRLFNDIPGLVSFTSVSMIIYKITSYKVLNRIQQLFLAIGKISYEFYLVHYLIYSVLMYFLKNNGITYTIFYVPVLLAVALIIAKGFQVLLTKLNRILNLIKSSSMVF